MKNKSVIIIDSQVFEIEIFFSKHIKDIETNKTIQYLFSNIIEHINIICFVYNSLKKYINGYVRYTYNEITALFAEDIINNFIFLFTNVHKRIIKTRYIYELLSNEIDVKLIVKREIKIIIYIIISILI